MESHANSERDMSAKDDRADTIIEVTIEKVLASARDDGTSDDYNGQLIYTRMGLNYTDDEVKWARRSAKSDHKLHNTYNYLFCES